MTKEVITESGLRMLEIFSGAGEKPIDGQKVLIHYELYLGDGVTSSDFDYDAGKYRNNLIYDSTYEDKPFNGPIDIIIGKKTPKDDTYTIGDSIKGLDEALLDMQVGSKRKLLIPSELAYGVEGASSFHTFHGYRMPTNHKLAITVELVEIK